MRKLTVAAALILGVLMSFGISLADEAKKAQPPLPDYTKAPYEKRGEFNSKAREYPELGMLSCVTYSTSLSPDPGASAINVCKDADGKNFLLAYWIQVNDEGTSETGRVYLYKKDAWVFDKEDTHQ